MCSPVGYLPQSRFPVPEDEDSPTAVAINIGSMQARMKVQAAGLLAAPSGLANTSSPFFSPSSPSLAPSISPRKFKYQQSIPSSPSMGPIPAATSAPPPTPARPKSAKPPKSARSRSQEADEDVSGADTSSGQEASNSVPVLMEDGAIALVSPERAQTLQDLQRLTTKDDLTRLLMVKVRNSRFEEFEDIMASGKVGIDFPDSWGNTALIVACQSGSKKMVKAVLRCGANINAQNYKGNTALHYCFSFKYIPCTHGAYALSSIITGGDGRNFILFLPTLPIFGPAFDCRVIDVFSFAMCVCVCVWRD
jgi:hypothetical protein